LAAAVATFIDSFDDTSTPWGKNLINRWRVPLGSDPWSRPGDSGTPWPSGGGIWQVSTPHGPGFRMVVTDEMRVVSGGKLAFLADIGHLVGPVGSTEDWSGTVVFPAAGNPHGFPRKYLDWGVSSNSTGTAASRWGWGSIPPTLLTATRSGSVRTPSPGASGRRSPRPPCLRPLVLLADPTQVELWLRRVRQVVAG
jgi:hypothetical protein